jgi:hypothetical protein
MEWFGASVIAPRENASLEFELAGERTLRSGSYRDATFFDGSDAIGYPRRLVRRWRYASMAVAIATPASRALQNSDPEGDAAVAEDLSCE